MATEMDRAEDPLLERAVDNYGLFRRVFKPRPGSLISRVVDRYGEKCYLRYDDHCEGYANSIDHVIPRSKGGPNIMWNLRPACKPCNVRKGDKLPAGVLYRVGQRDQETRTWPGRRALCKHFPGWVCSHTECAPKVHGTEERYVLQVA